MHLAHRHLVRAPEAFGLFAVDFFWARPSLGRAQYDHGPKRPLALTIAKRSCLNALDLLNNRIKRGRHELVHFFRLFALDEIGGVAVAAEKVIQLFVTNPGQHAGIGDLVTVEVKDRQHNPIGGRIQKFVRVPTGCHRPDLSLAVPDDTTDDQIRVIVRRPVSMRYGVPQLASLVNRTWRLWRDVTRDTARK